MNNKSFAVWTTIALIVVLGLVGVAIVHNGSHTAPVQPEQPVGALASPTIPANYLSVNNVRTEYRFARFHTTARDGIASSTVCSILPPTASSTLALATFNVSNAATTTYYMQIATSTSPSATTSPLAGWSSITSTGSTTPYLNWTPPQTASSNGGSINGGGGIFVNFAISSSGILKGLIDGTCSAVFNVDSY